MKTIVFVSLLLASCAAVPEKGPSVPKPAYAFQPDVLLVCYEGYWVIYSALAEDAKQFTAKCGPQI